MRRVSISVLLGLVVSCAIHGQTRLAPSQVKAWQQVAPPNGGTNGGTAIRLNQLAIDPAWIDLWVGAMQAGYDHYNVAVVNGQPFPVLITCARPDSSPLGPGCAGGLFWFSRRP